MRVGNEGDTPYVTEAVCILWGGGKGLQRPKKSLQLLRKASSAQASPRQPNSAQPNSAQPNSAQPNSAQPNSAQPSPTLQEGQMQQAVQPKKAFAVHELMLCIIFIASLMLAGTSGCGQRPMVAPPGGSRILGGHFAPEGAWPWQVSIQWMYHHVCSGSIISHQWILSAAHCFSRSRYFSGSSRLQVVAGLHSLSKRGKAVQSRSVERVIVHKDFDKDNYENDVALLQLHSPLFFTAHVQPVCTLKNEAEERDLSFSTCFISGWGSTEFEGKLVDTLREAEVELIDTDTCNQRDWYSGYVSDNMVCAGLERGGVDTCQGDSGGPLSCYSEVTGRFYIYGVTSHGENCGLPKKPGLYARASRYATWVRKTQERFSSAAELNPGLHVIIILILLYQAWTLI
ncbi:chymotrypsin-like elastase family member 2A [Salminus brasiliensis]|uniref:chymotrypsin-like elastase family member 2A n=1 Tax=Salminus brasiliensis TaxID=930266 RepID=UPI003B837AA0